MLARKLIAAMAGQASGAAAYRYWRIYVQANNAPGSAIQFTEVELRATAGGADLTTTSTPVTASSSYPGADYQPTNLVNGNTSNTSGWASNLISTNQWVRFDLGSAASIAQVAIHPHSSFTVNPKDFIIQGSNDGTTFTDLKSFAGVSGWAANTWKTFDL